MRPLKVISLPITFAVTIALTSIAAAAQSKVNNWPQDYVKLREHAALERAIGVERAAKVRAAAAKIVGGTVAKAAANPFQVALLFKSTGNQYCGGSLYKPNVVVTAAHCSDFVSAGQVQVLTGTRRLDGTGTRRDVSSITIYPSFDPSTLDSDVAVWVLTSSATGIELAKLASLLSEATTGKTLATGWGNTETSGFPVALRQVIVPLQPKSDCNDADSYGGAVTDNMICAGLDAGGKDTCQGDSGGPLTARPVGSTGGIGTYDILTGITSWGIGCADPELFGVYTRVAKFRAWINQQLP